MEFFQFFNALQQFKNLSSQISQFIFDLDDNIATMLPLDHDHDPILHTSINYVTHSNETTTTASIEHDHDYGITHTIDDNIEATLSIDQNFGVYHYENNEVNILKTLKILACF